MDLFQQSRYIIMLLVCWLGWLCGVAFGEVSEAFTGSVNFPGIGLTCIGNLAVLIKVLLRGKHWYVCDACDKARIIGKREKLKNINEVALQSCSVVMFSFEMHITRSMRSLCNVCDVHPIFLQCLPLQQSVPMCTDVCTENKKDGRCRCIVFNAAEDITMILARRMPGILKRLSDKLCLPSLSCLRNGCHGCDQGLLYVDENDILRQGDPELEHPAAVCKILDLESIEKARTCICIPLRSANEDDWTNQLIELFKPDDNEFRGAVIRNGSTSASSALENYKNGNGECDADEKYKLASLVILPKLTTILINFVLTFWFKVDGLSSYVVAMRSLQKFHHNGFFPHKFLTRARVKSDADNTNVCQVLYFRHDLQSLALSHYPEEIVRNICSYSWMWLVATEGGANKWYHTHSVAPSKPIIVVILVAICIALIMDGFDVNLYLQIIKMRRLERTRHHNICIAISATMILEILCIVACSAVAGVMGIKVFGRWVYSALHFLVMVKAALGLYLSNQNCLESLWHDSPEYRERMWWYDSFGLYVHASAFLLNATLAGVRAKWEFS